MNLDSKTIFKIFSSILWGIGLAAIFSQICKIKNCVILKGVHPDKIKDQVFGNTEDHFTKKNCFKLVEEKTECTESSILV